MSTIQENLRATLLSLKQISDRLKSLVTNSSTKTDVSNAKGDIITAIGNIPEPDLSSLATEVNATSNKNAVIAAIPSVANIQNGLAKTSELPDVSGLATASALSSVATDAASAASDAAAAKTAAQAITGYALQGSGNSTQTDIATAIGTPATGQPSTLFEAIAAGGGGGGIEIMTDDEYEPALSDLENMLDDIDVTDEN